MDSNVPVPFYQDAVKSSETDAEPPSRSTCVVEFRNGGNDVDRVELIINGNMSVQDALEQSKATKRYRRMNIAVIRPIGDTQHSHKMDVEYLADNRHVAAHTDYALHDGDRIIVTQEHGSFVDRALDPVLGPIDRIITR